MDTALAAETAPGWIRSSSRRPRLRSHATDSSFSRASEEKVTVLDFTGDQRRRRQAKRVLRAQGGRRNLPDRDPAQGADDATRASQLLLNLCINAHDAMPKGGAVTITNALVLSPRTGQAQAQA